MQEENQLETPAGEAEVVDAAVTAQHEQTKHEVDPGKDAAQWTPETENQQPAQRQVSPDVETRARDMGWRPQNEWRGDPQAWRPADEFLRRGEEVLPIVRSRAQRAEAEVANLRGQIAERDRDFEDRLRRLDRVQQIALQNQAQQISQYYQSQMRQAVERGDVEGYDNLNRRYADEIGNLQTRTAEAYQQPATQEQKQQQKPIDPAVQRTVQQWIGGHDWWSRDQEMTQEAVDFHGYLLDKKPWLTVEANLEAVEKHLEREFPNKFPKRAAPTNGNGQRQQQPQNHAPAMEAGTRQPAGSGRTKGWNELPPEAKKAGEGFISQELYTNDAKGRAEYAADYWSQD